MEGLSIVPCSLQQNYSTPLHGIIYYVCLTSTLHCTLSVDACEELQDGVVIIVIQTVLHCDR